MNEDLKAIEDLRLYTLDEIAPLLGVTKQTLLNYIRSGKLIAKKIGRNWRITGEMLRNYIEGAESTPRKYKRRSPIMDMGQLESWYNSLKPEQIAYLIERGVYTASIKGYVLSILQDKKKVDYLKATPNRIAIFLYELGEKLNTMDITAAEKIYKDYEADFAKKQEQERRERPNG